MKILITAFDPFGGERINPAYEAVTKLREPEGAALIRLKVPTVFGKSIKVMTEAMEKEKNDVLICVGQAGGRSAITPERVAINIMDASIPDNEGNMPQDQPVISGSKNALLSTLPVKKIVEAINAAGISSRLSSTAGTFICNQLMYEALALCKDRFPNTLAGFIHVPYMTEQLKDKPDMPGMSEDEIVRGLEAAIGVFL